MTTISYGETTSTPVAVTRWSQSSESATVVHRIIGGGIEVTREPTAPRTFTLSLVFLDEADAVACVELHRTAPYLDLVSDSRDVANGRYVVAEGGQVALELNPTTLGFWTVTVDAQDIS